MKIIPISTERVEIQPTQKLSQWILESIENNQETLEDSDILVISSKIVSYFEGRIIKSEKTIEELAREEADEVVANTPWVLLCRKNGIYTANAGIDSSNVPEGHVALWPEEPFESAKNLRESLKSKLELEKLAVIINDSACTPGRNGTISVAIGYSGLRGYQDLKGSQDLYKNTLKYSALNIVDSLATSANLIMGEGNESVPLCIIRDYNYEISENKNDEMIISPSDEMFPLKKE